MGRFSFSPHNKDFLENLRYTFGKEYCHMTIIYAKKKKNQKNKNKKIPENEVT